jgi:hypothetical protein
LLAGSRIERGRKNRRNIRKSVTRKMTTLDQTIRRRILFTAGSGALSTTAPAGFATDFAAGGNGGFAAGVEVLSLFAARS